MKNRKYDETIYVTPSTDDNLFIESYFADNLERDASPEWRAYAWQDGEIVGSGHGRTKLMAEKNMWKNIQFPGPTNGG
jgi:hypothetical protein